MFDTFWSVNSGTRGGGGWTVVTQSVTSFMQPEDSGDYLYMEFNVGDTVTAQSRLF